MATEREHSFRRFNPIEATLNRPGSKVTKEVFDIWKELLEVYRTSVMEISFGQALKEDSTGSYQKEKLNIAIQQKYL